MARWKSLDILFPGDGDADLFTSILGLFVGPMPHLTKLSLRDHASLQLSTPIFPDLPSLKSLHINTVQLLEQINPPFSSVENLTIGCFYATDFQIARLDRFTSLKTLTILPGFGYYGYDPVSTTVTLPSLKEITFQWTIPSPGVHFDLRLLSSLHIEYLRLDFSSPLPIMFPRSVILLSMQSSHCTSRTLEGIIRQYGSMETLSVSECLEADLKVIVEKLRGEGSLHRTFNLVRVVSNRNQEMELRVWQIQ
jgi:hypothetical protein